MTNTSIKIETADDGITLSQDSQSPEWSITGKGGRTDMVFISNEDAPALIEALRATQPKEAA
jgi:hypothetical protein